MFDTKEKILYTALRLFAKDGYEAVSVSKIAGELGMTKGALYKHYRNKRDIFDSIVERMNQMDYTRAHEYDVPEDTFEQMPLAYHNTSMDKIKAFSEAQFNYWTEDEFASNFRKLLTLEQYRDPEMNALYQQYLAGGPLGYMEDLFREMFELGELKESDPKQLALEFYAAIYLFISISDATEDKKKVNELVRLHINSFISNYTKKGGETKMEYMRSKKYDTQVFNNKIMGPNPIKLEEELMLENKTPAGSVVCDLGSGQGVTSVFLAKEYGFTVYAADLWSDPEENQKFFDEVGLSREQVIPIKADATNLPFEKEFFDAVVSTDSYNYFGRDPKYLGEKLLPFVKKGGYIYIAIPGMKQDCHGNLPEELLLSWTPEQLDYMHDVAYWTNIVEQTTGIEIFSIHEMKSNEEVWHDWLKQENEYAISDRKAMEAGGGKYLNFIAIILKKK